MILLSKKVYFNVNYGSKTISRMAEFSSTLESKGYGMYFDERCRTLTMEEIVPSLQGYYALVLDSTKITASLLDQVKDLRIISRTGVGYDNIDMAACTAREVAVTIAPGVGAKAVAEHTFALMLAVSRRIVEMDRAVRNGEWKRYIGPALYEKTLGLIGFGNIGRQLAKVSGGFSMKICAYDPYQGKRESGITYYEKLDDLLKVSDYVSIHCPLTPETQNMITLAQLKQMKPTAILINASRGGIVNEKDLYRALTEDVILGAGLDVLEQEPPEKNCPFFSLENVVLTTHNAGSSVEGKSDIVAAALQNIFALDNGEKPVGLLNPDVLKTPHWSKIHI